MTSKTNDTKPMNPYHQFLRLVWKMRKAQKDDQIFHSRRTRAACDSIERDVDKWMETVGFASAKIKQMTLEVELEKDVETTKKESGDV
jgi:chaperonin cofactor prefoldin